MWWSPDSPHSGSITSLVLCFVLAPAAANACALEVNFGPLMAKVNGIYFPFGHWANR